jgi:hypothetical protein
MTKIQDLEKRVTKLEEELTILKNLIKTDDNTHSKRHNKTKKKTKKRIKSITTPVTKHATKKRKVNEYFKMMLEAKKAGKPSFVYKGNTYKGTKHKRLGMIYKKA